LFGKRKHQIEAMLGDAVAYAVRYAKDNLIPIVIENLDLDKKKSGRSKKTNRKVSMMAYSAFRQVLSSRAFREGVEVIGINPTYTSVIGLVKFGPGYKLTPHEAAAVAIARRGLGFGERLTIRRLRYTFCLPVRNRRKHVWSDWRVASECLSVSKKINAPVAGKQATRQEEYLYPQRHAFTRYGWFTGFQRKPLWRKSATLFGWRM
jgi:IS605 OrfB family transposase